MIVNSGQNSASILAWLAFWFPVFLNVVSIRASGYFKLIGDKTPPTACDSSEVSDVKLTLVEQ